MLKQLKQQKIFSLITNAVFGNRVKVKLLIDHKLKTHTINDVVMF